MSFTQIEVSINGQARSFPKALTLEQLIQQLKLAPNQVAVEVNHQLVPRREHAERQIQPGDKLEIVSLAGGG